MVITMAKLRMEQTSWHGPRKPPGSIINTTKWFNESIKYITFQSTRLELVRAMFIFQGQHYQNLDTCPSINVAKNTTELGMKAAKKTS